MATAVRIYMLTEINFKDSKLFPNIRVTEPINHASKGGLE